MRRSIFIPAALPSHSGRISPARLVYADDGTKELGKREIPRENEHVSYHRKERLEGAFNRTVTLPVEVDPERVEARYAEGVLTLTLPKAEQAKPRQIAVRT